jgi:flagellar motor protein MotB
MELARLRAELEATRARLRAAELDALKLTSPLPAAALPARLVAVNAGVASVRVEGSVPFGLGRGELGPLGERALARLLPSLEAAIAEGPAEPWSIEVEGRTDARPIGRAAFDSNETLAAARAAAVAERLIAAGLPRDRLRLLSRPGDRSAGSADDARAVIVRLVGG